MLSIHILIYISINFLILDYQYKKAPPKRCFFVCMVSMESVGYIFCNCLQLFFCGDKAVIILAFRFGIIVLQLADLYECSMYVVLPYS